MCIRFMRQMLLVRRDLYLVMLQQFASSVIDRCHRRLVIRLRLRQREFRVGQLRLRVQYEKDSAST